jgi:hypothetical protein
MPAPGRPGPVGLSQTQVQSDPQFKLRGPKRRARWQPLPGVTAAEAATRTLGGDVPGPAAPARRPASSTSA